ncbi:hypothetical protein BGW42_006030 [Actinomortierella wolfii]|nr:hypothetical protein BGW42_006030 [Actinomortierella wolfii]
MTVSWTRIPRPTRDSSGRETTIYIPVTTLVPTVIPDPNQAPPPPPDDYDGGSKTSGMKPWQIVLVVLAAILILFAAMAAIFVGRLHKKRKMLRLMEEERLKREALLQAGADLPGGATVDVDDLAMGRFGGPLRKRDGGGMHRPDMTAVTTTATAAGPMMAAQRQPSMEHFRGGYGEEYVASQGPMHRPSMSTSSELTSGAIMMLEEHPPGGGGGGGGGSGVYYYDYYGYPQDPSAFREQPETQQGSYQRRSYPLPPMPANGGHEALLSDSHDQYAEGYGHGYDAGGGTGVGAAGGAGSSTAVPSPYLPPPSQGQPPRDRPGTVVSDLDRHPSTGNQTNTSSVSPPLSGQGATTSPTTTITTTSGSAQAGGTGTRRATTPTVGPSVGSGTSRELSTGDFIYQPVVHNPHTEYVHIQPTGVYAPSAPNSPQMLQIGRTHVQDASGAVRSIDVDPGQLERHAKEENRRKDPNALIGHDPPYPSWNTS